MSKIIGMSRNIKLEWLDKAADLYIIGKSEEEIKEELNEYLSFEIKSPTNLRKTREILINIWAKDMEYMEQSKNIAVKLYESDVEGNRLLIHWCLMLLAYPVFADICGVIGKMDSKMFDINNKEIRNRMFDLWGERSTLYHSIEKNIKTLRDIGVLYSLPKHRYGIKRYNIENEDGLILLASTLLVLRDKLYLNIEELNNSPEFFPFNYDISVNILGESNMFSIDKFGRELTVSKNN